MDLLGTYEHVSTQGIYEDSDKVLRSYTCALFSFLSILLHLK